MGLKPDLGLEGDQYQWLGSLFYFGEFCLRAGSVHQQAIGQTDRTKGIWRGNTRQIDCFSFFLWGSTRLRVSSSGAQFFAALLRCTIFRGQLLFGELFDFLRAQLINLT